MLDEEALRLATARSRSCSSLVSFDTSFLIPSTSPLWVCLARSRSSLSCRSNVGRTWGSDAELMLNNKNKNEKKKKKMNKNKNTDPFRFSHRRVTFRFQASQFLLRLQVVISLFTHHLQPESREIKAMTRTEKRSEWNPLTTLCALHFFFLNLLQVDFSAYTHLKRITEVQRHSKATLHKYSIFPHKD